MDESSDDRTGEHEIDVRTVPRGQRHPLIFDAYRKLAVGESFVLLNDHEPRHLREDFDRVLVFDSGHLVADAAPAEALAHYRKLMDA